MNLRTKTAAASKRSPKKRGSARRPPPATSGNPRSAKVALWDNSLAFRISQDVAEQLGLKAGAHVTVDVQDGNLLVKPVRRKWTEAELLAGVTPEAVGGEIDSGPPVGKEFW